MKRYKIILAIVTFSFIALSAGYHVIYNQFVESGQSHFYRQGQKIKESGRKNNIIIDFAERKITYESKVLKATWTGTVEEFKKGADEAAQAMLDERMKDFPPPLREQFKRNLKEQRKAFDTVQMKVVITPLKEKETIAGYSCKKYKVTVNGGLEEYFYHTTAVSPYAGLDFDLLKAEGFATPDAFDYHWSPQYMRYRYKGLIMKVLKAKESYDDLQPTAEVVDVKQEKVDPSVFGPTAAFKPMPVKELLIAEMKETEKESDKD